MTFAPTRGGSAGEFLQALESLSRRVARFSSRARYLFIALGGEVVVDYSLRFKRQYGFDNLWVAGYSNDVFAYILSLRVLLEVGYEGGGASSPTVSLLPSVGRSKRSSLKR